MSAPPPVSIPSDSAITQSIEFARVGTEVEQTSGASHPNSESGQNPLEPPSGSDQPAELSAEQISWYLARLERENAYLQQRLTQLQADLEQTRRAAAGAWEENRLQARAELMEQLLPLVDNFDQVLTHATAGAVGEELVTGVAVIYKHLADLLERHGVVPVISVGEIFNPRLHEAVIIEPRPGYAANTIIAEFEKGYTIGTRLLRPARVKVAIRQE